MNARQRTFSITRVLRRTWLLLAVLIVVVVAALGIYRLHTMLRVQSLPPIRIAADDDLPQFAPKRVTYEVFGPAPTAKIAYLDPDARVQRLADTPLPWSQTVETPLPAVTVNLLAQSGSDQIGCRILVNGTVKDERSETGPKALTFCQVTSA
ncbi:MmpS family transport accessory protein [Mycobacterium camsae]|uniref:MmpS family transport accessory protein n=1 Tax=Mycobacterium gordonae TaxID=1778 RepID=UPI00197E6E75|nr:MmpS family transport accessory protein [Mycobacterium gordonae]